MYHSEFSISIPDKKYYGAEKHVKLEYLIGNVNVIGNTNYNDLVF